MSSVRWLRTLGPGLLVTAAFIGPGTVTTASVAGARFGYDLLWALVFSVVATIVLQEMSARLGLVSRAGLGEALRTTFENRLVRVLSIILVVAALVFGNAAFQTGNVTGAAIALEALTGVSRPVWALAVGAIAFALLVSGRYRWIERFLMVMVGAMSIVFLTTAVVVRPSPSGIVSGVVVPSLPSGSLLTVMALIGTTVVPYNLFLHASVVCEKWSEATPLHRALRDSRFDTLFSIGLGGMVTLSIIVTAAVFFERGTRIDSAVTMAQQLEPVLGPAARYFFATGLLGAGLTSAVTAPLAAAYAVSGALGWSPDFKAFRFRLIWATVVLVGTLLAMFGRQPVAAILFAQAANGVLLPLVAVFLLIVMNRQELLGVYRNRVVANLLGGTVVLVVSGLGVFQLLRVLLGPTGAD
jgi:manganese transport protein